MEDWDLQAVVKGYTNVEAFVTKPSSFSPLSYQLDHFDFTNFNDEFPETARILDQFEELGKFSTQSVLTSSSTHVPREAKKPREEFHGSFVSPVASSTARTPPSKPRRRRSDEKRVVEELTSEKLALDTWAWRKYGQKPIKGSPYPRSYYRCSSSKGCPARRQVEQSPSNPKIFIVTYSAEHNHAKPTKRSSLAGTTRTKSSFNTRGEEHINKETEDICVQGNVEGEKEEEEDQQTMKNSDNCEYSNRVTFSEDLFPTLEEIAGFSSDWTFEYDP